MYFNSCNLFCVTIIARESVYWNKKFDLLQAIINYLKSILIRITSRISISWNYKIESATFCERDAIKMFGLQAQRFH